MPVAPSLQVIVDGPHAKGLSKKFMDARRERLEYAPMQALLDAPKCRIEPAMEHGEGPFIRYNSTRHILGMPEFPMQPRPVHCHVGGRLTGCRTSLADTRWDEIATEDEALTASKLCQRYGCFHMWPAALHALQNRFAR